jgi:hypothetical protein
MVQPIANCPMEFVCDRKWDDLASTAQEGVRRCAQCDTDVHFCHTIEELLQHASLKHCVAFNLVEDDRPRHTGTQLLGLPGDFRGPGHPG